MLALFLVATPAYAVLSPEAVGCRAGLAAGARGVGGSALKAEVACHAARFAGGVSPATDCNNTTGLPALYRSKIDKAHAKLMAKSTAACAPAPAAAALGYTVCEAPCDIAVSDYASVAQCVSCLTQHEIDTLISETHGNAPAPNLDAPPSQCRKLLSKGLRKYTATRLRQQHQCQKLLDKGGLDASADCKMLLPAAAGSKLEKMAAKLAKAKAKLDAAIAACDDSVDLSSTLGSCGVDKESLQNCAEQFAAAASDAVFDYIFFPPVATPTSTPTATTTRTRTPTRTPTKTPTAPTPTVTHAGTDASTIFVSVNIGNDANPGTRQLPKKTIQEGIDTVAAFLFKTRVCIDGGLYNESLTLQSGMIIEGGFDASLGWSKGTVGADTIVSGGTSALLGVNVSNITIRGLTVFSADAASNGSSYGIRLASADNITIDECVINAGAGGPGSSAGPAVDGEPGIDGVGVNLCAVGGTAGKGGAPGPAGMAGADGGGPLGGAGGINGANGGDGAAGANGAKGAQLGSFAATTYAVSIGSDGSKGQHGSGGGGGAGSSGGGDGDEPAYGGGGGCGAFGADGAKSGGGSFAIYAQSNSDGAITVTNSILRTSSGGPGGNAKAGGNGGGGGGPGCGAHCGGFGGDGGNGGAGGAGSGGPSIGIACGGSSSHLMSAAVTYDLGGGGPGGSSPGNSGQTGANKNTHACLP